MLPLLVAGLLLAAWLPTTEFNGICRAMPTWVDEYSRVCLPPQLVTGLWLLWHAHSTYAIACAAELEQGLLIQTLFSWCALKFWASSFFGQSVLLLGYFASALLLLASAYWQFQTASTAGDFSHAVDTWVAATLGFFALWNLDVFQRIMRQKHRKTVTRTVLPARTKESSRRRRLVGGDKRWQPAGASKR